MRVHDQEQRVTGGRQGWELPALLEAITRLYRQLAARVWCKRYRSSRNGAEARQAAPIHDTLAPHLDTRAVESESDQGAAQDPPASPQGAMPGGGRHPTPGKPGLFKSLSRHFSRRHAPIHQPHLAEQMRAKTTEHINRAVQLARSGNADGAKMHAQLAEQAMSTASQYMDPEAYEAFKADVELRLGRIAGA